ncbi:MAG: S8 family serine peptidase [Chloroflexaceae bacterium]|nr:S8 family serine peptidase [Chloroflexaceae bacterium]
MNRFLVLLAGLLLGIGVLPAHATPPAHTLPTEPHPDHADTLLINLAPPLSLTAEARLAATLPEGRYLESALVTLNAYAAEPISPDGQTYLLHLHSATDVQAAAARLTGIPGVRYVEPNYYRKALRVPNDEAVNQQWALTNIQAYEAWDITTGAEIVIAVLDTGVRASHPDLRGKVLAGFNGLSQTDLTDDDNGHGTAVAGLNRRQHRQ